MQRRANMRYCAASCGWCHEKVLVKTGNQVVVDMNEQKNSIRTSQHSFMHLHAAHRGAAQP